MKSVLLSLSVIFLLINNAIGQITDSVALASTTMELSPNHNLAGALFKMNEERKNLKSLILPASLITYGFISLESDGLKALDNHIKEEIWTDHPHKPIKVDNYLQYAPAAAVYGLNAIGIKGKNNFRDRTMIYLMSNAIMGIAVQPIKKITHIQRPDGFGSNAFPSGHTATAFVAAEFLHQEYKDASPWYGVAGYAMATTTAYLRMYNNRHWFRDLLPGAGIGILSTKLAYWIYPTVKRKLFKGKSVNTSIMPYYQDKTAGLALVHNF
ncbi:MAG TPA: phosphatase PAP2 family protein [Chitinophagaceae bacterium]